MMKYFVSLSLLLFAISSFAQRPYNEIIANSMVVKQKDGLGMMIVAEEDGKSVMVSKTGRYIVKGTLTDMWNGMQLSKEQPASFPQFPKMLNKNDFALSFGDSKSRELLVYLSYSCLQCESLVTQLFEKRILDKYKVRVILVYNNDFDKNIVKNVYCAKDRESTFKKIFLRRDLSDLHDNCKSNEQGLMNNTLANAHFIKALPTSFVESSGKLYLGLLPSSL